MRRFAPSLRHDCIRHTPCAAFLGARRVSNTSANGTRRVPDTLANGTRRVPDTPGFTLVELLVAIVVIGILAGIVLGALQAAREAGKEARTKATIAKLNHIITAKYESYLTRRVAINTVGMTPKAAATARFNALMDLIRMEMPDRWTDVTKDPTNPGANPPANTPLVLPYAPALTYRYYSAFNTAYSAASPAGQVNILKAAGAECLYLIVANTPGALEGFNDSDLGDVEGMRVFVDAWGKPILFLRWPAGFVALYQGDSAIQTDDIASNPDPFDPRKVLGGFAMYPLIYSAGGDKQYDINVGKTGATGWYAYKLVSGNLDPEQKDGNGVYIGQPQNNDTGLFSNLRHFDNVHNHRIESR